MPQCCTLTLWCPLLPYGYSYKSSCAKPGYAVICNFWHPGTLTISPERQSGRMSKCVVPNVDIGLQSGWFWATVNCFIQGEVIGFQVLMDSLHPRSTTSPWWSPPVLQGPWRTGGDHQGDVVLRGWPRGKLLRSSWHLFHRVQYSTINKSLIFARHANLSYSSPNITEP